MCPGSKSMNGSIFILGTPAMADGKQQKNWEHRPQFNGNLFHLQKNTCGVPRNYEEKIKVFFSEKGQASCIALFHQNLG